MQNENEKILILDDDPAMVRLLQKVLERSDLEDIEIQGMTNPTLAMEIIDDGDVDILVTDLQMPELDGLEVVRRTKKRNACIQVLFITGHSTYEALLEALEMGANDYLMKPVDQLELIDLIQQALERHRRWKSALAETLKLRSDKPATLAT